ncbi:MAG: OmpA family [Proteobacteria bacterium]|nr:OmpA family [Pseudomonadota bacterium]
MPPGHARRWTVGRPLPRDMIYHEMAGIAGAAGDVDAAGPQGATGQTGARGPMIGGGGWSPYRDYTFNANSDAVLNSDGNTAWEIAEYLKQNPSARVAIDGFNQNRVSSVRDALISAGVPPSKIQAGAFGDPQLRRNGLVAVLVRS